MKFYFKFRSFVPLIVIILVVLALTIAKAAYTGLWMGPSLMIDFMGWWLIIFGGFKLVNLSAFAGAYSMYDIIAKRFKVYGFVYPFIELVLGLMFLFRFELTIASWITLILMIINSVGAYRGIRDKKVLMCACLGTVFKLPMSYVSLAEDLLMAVMALIIILGL